MERNRLRRDIADSAQALLRDLPKAALPVSALEAGTTPAFTPKALQQINGINNLRQIGWLRLGLSLSDAVCRILTPGGLGTGFLIGPRTLMTANHVIPSEADARDSFAEFGYQLAYSLGRSLLDSVAEPSTRYRLDPDSRFETNQPLDYTIVDVHEEPDAPALARLGHAKLNPFADPVVDDHVTIIQHPNGQLKQICLTANAVIAVEPPFIHYTTDTMPGSSGSPVFNDLWEVVAIHHASGPFTAGRHTNEGILMSSIKPTCKEWPRE